MKTEDEAVRAALELCFRGSEYEVEQVIGLPITLQDLHRDTGFEGLPVLLKNNHWVFVGRDPQEDVLRRPPDEWSEIVKRLSSGLMGFVDACARSPV